MLEGFCGTGGWSIGFWREGFDCYGTDIVDVGYPYHLTLSDIKEYHPPQGISVIVQSPPCTEFSPLTMLSYKKGQRGPPDPEKGVALVKEAMRVIKEAEPQYWLIENVWGSMKYLVPFLDLPKVVVKPWVLWGNFPYPNLAKEIPKKILGKKGNKIGLPEDFPLDPLRSWKRARIPVFLSQRVAKACKQALDSKSFNLA